MFGEPLRVIAAEAGGEPPFGPMIGGALIALGLTLLLWPVSGYLITAAHEGGHAFFCSASGGSVAEVLLRLGRTGKTGVKGLGPVGDDVTTFAGYVSPSLFGVLGAIILDGGRIRSLLWLGLFFLFLLLLQVNNLFGVLVVLAGGAVVVWILRDASGGGQAVAAYTWTWFLLFGGVRHVMEHMPSSGDKGRVGMDAVLLQGTTHVPAGLWMWIFFVVSVAGLLFGGGILLGLVGQYAAR